MEISEYTKSTQEEFIGQFVNAAKNADSKWDVPASMSLAQCCWESGWGHHIPNGTHNPFGIKALPGLPSTPLMTSEFIHGRYVRLVQRFAIFPSWDGAFDQHGKLIHDVPDYRAAFDAATVEDFVIEVAKHYASDPHYASNILTIMGTHNLYQYDK